MSFTIEPKNKLDERLKFAECYKELLRVFDGIDTQALKEADTIELICNLVENKYQTIKKTHRKKINKKEVVIELIKKFVSLEPTELQMIESIIEKLHSCGRIKLISTFKLIKKGVLGYFTFAAHPHA